MAKCSECGFLASRNYQSRILEETEQKTRNEGLVAEIHEAPICFVRAGDLWAESGRILGSVSFSEVPTILSTIQKERDCGQFAKWHQGFTPKEQQEMIDREKRLTWQIGREEADKRWREQQEIRHSKEEWHRYILCICNKIFPNCLPMHGNLDYTTNKNL